MSNGRQRSGGHGAAIAAAATVVGVGGVTVYYARTQFDLYKKNGGTKYTSFWQWMLAGMPSKDSTTPTIAPTIYASSNSVLLTDEYSLSGGGCTPGGSVTINSTPYSTPSTHTVAGDGTFTTGMFAASATTTSIGTFVFTATDNTTGKVSATPATVTFTSISTNPPGSQGNPFNYAAGWQGAGWYTNIPGQADKMYIGTLAVYNEYTGQIESAPRVSVAISGLTVTLTGTLNPGGASSYQYTVVSGSGIPNTQITSLPVSFTYAPAGTYAMSITDYFSDGNQTYVNASFTLSVIYGTESNPWVAVNTYQGVGYYARPGCPTYYIGSEAQFVNWWNFGNPNPPAGTEGNPYTPGAGTGTFLWQGAGYYEIPSGETYIPATGMRPGVAYYVSDEAFIAGVNSWLA